MFNSTVHWTVFALSKIFLSFKILSVQGTELLPLHSVIVVHFQPFLIQIGPSSRQVQLMLLCNTFQQLFLCNNYLSPPLTTSFTLSHTILTHRGAKAQHLYQQGSCITLTCTACIRSTLPRPILHITITAQVLENFFPFVFCLQYILAGVYLYLPSNDRL